MIFLSRIRPTSAELEVGFARDERRAFPRCGIFGAKTKLPWTHQEELAFIAGRTGKEGGLGFL